jgi:hypothetical protein
MAGSGRLPMCAVGRLRTFPKTAIGQKRMFAFPAIILALVNAAPFADCFTKITFPNPVLKSARCYPYAI